MRRVTAQFLKTATHPPHYPTGDYPEVAFAGRSNVGKSSLINCLVRQRGLAKTSSQPGRTQALNFFLVNESLMFVDLPGYGYSKVPASVQARWKPMVETYLRERSNLRGVVQIVDLRHPPTETDCALWEWLRHYGIPRVVVATKADKLSRSQQHRNLPVVGETLGLAKDDALIPFSALRGSGRDQLWRWIDQVTAADAPEREVPPALPAQGRRTGPARGTASGARSRSTGAGGRDTSAGRVR